MKKLQFVLMAVAMILTTGLQTGCQTKLEPGGKYQGDTLLYNADRAITGAYDILDTFVTWEYQNRAALASQPEITKAADAVRANAKQWIRSAVHMREVYASNPTPENRKTLENAIAVLRQAMTEATNYLASRQAARTQ